MALPEDFDTVRVYGTYTNPDGTPAQGFITFRPSVRVRSAADSLLVVPSEVRVRLDAVGYLEVDLPATDDPNTTPNGWVYHVHESVTSADKEPYSISVPLGADLDLTGAVPVETVDPTYTPVLTINGVGPDSSGNVEAVVGAVDWDNVLNKPVIPDDPEDIGAQPAGDYATNPALTSGLSGKANTSHTHAYSTLTGLPVIPDSPDDIGAQPAGDYATNAALTSGLASKQATGDYATNTALTNGLAGKAGVSHTHSYSTLTGLPTIPSVPGDIGAQPAGDYATNTALTTGLSGKSNTGHTHAYSTLTGLPSIPNSPDDIGAQPAGDYATNAALTSGLAGKQPTGDYATNTALTSGLAGKQATGDYATNTALTSGLASKQPTGDYATNTALTSGLAGKAATSHTHTIANVTGLQTQLDSFATTTSVNSKFTSLLFNVKDFGAVGNSSTNDVAAIQAAIDACAAAGGGVVFFPAGTYGIGTFTGTGISKRALSAKPGVTLRGAGREVSSLRVFSSIGDYFTIIGQTSPGVNVDGFCVRDLTFDHNTANNPVASPATMVADLNTRASVVLYVGSRVVIENCRFMNIDCVWQTTSYGNDIVIRDNLYTNYVAAGAYHDSSSIYLSGKRNIVQGNIFNGTPGANGCFCAIETHGGGLSVEGNVINGFFSGANITGVGTTDTVGVLFQNNIITNVSIGVDLWSGTAGNTSGWGLENTIVSGNTITLDYDAWIGLANTCSGVMLDPSSNLGSRNVKIVNNVITFKSFSGTPTAADFHNAGITWYRPLSVTGLTDDTLEIDNNQITGAPGSGIYIQPKATVKNLLVRGNTIINPVAGGGAAYSSVYRVGIKISAAQDTFLGLHLENNYVVDSRATAVLTAGIDTNNITVPVIDGQCIDNVLRVVDAASTAVDFKQSATLTAIFAVRFRAAVNVGVFPRAGYYVGPSGTRTTLATVASVEYAVPIMVAASGTLSKIGCEIITGAAATTVRLGVRADANGIPGTLLLDAGTVDATATTASGIEITGLSLRLVPGIYWFTATSQGGTPTLRAETGDIWPSAAPSLASALGATANTGYTTAATVTGALPTTYTVSTRTGSPPRVVALIS